MFFKKKKKDNHPDNWMSIESRVYNAISRNDTARLKDLFNLGASPNMILNKRDNERPIHAAAAFGNRSTIDYLIEQGADPLAGIKLHAFCVLSPSGFAKMMNKPENSEHLKKIEQARCKQLANNGKKVPHFDKEYRPPLCYLSDRRQSSLPPRRP